MRTLVLLRHAKSSWDISGLDDFSRPLADRGLKAAPVMGTYLATLGASPELILCSTAVRTRQTLDLVLPTFTTPPGRILFEDSLYLASASDLLARLRMAPANADTVMFVGHNPGFHDLARGLAATGAPADVEALRIKFPTAAAAVLTFDARSWSDVGPRTGTLTHFATPGRLAAVR